MNVIERTDNNINLKDKISWKEFDFYELPDCCYTYAYFPVCKKITDEETGLEEKFGGSFPYLTKENLININKNEDEDEDNFIFLCQFKDPRIKDDNMYQVFIDSDSMNYKIIKIKLDEEIKEKQLKYDMKSDLEPYKIVKWNKVKELISFDNLKKYFKFPKKNENDLREQYYDHPLCPSSQIKAGGTPVTCQGGDYDHINLLQLTSMDFLNFEWGDSGIGHISSELELYWDCY